MKTFTLIFCLLFFSMQLNTGQADTQRPQQHSIAHSACQQTTLKCATTADQHFATCSDHYPNHYDLIRKHCSASLKKETDQCFNVYKKCYRLASKTHVRLHTTTN